MYDYDGGTPPTLLGPPRIQGAFLPAPDRHFLRSRIYSGTTTKKGRRHHRLQPAADAEGHAKEDP